MYIASQDFICGPSWRKPVAARACASSSLFCCAAGLYALLLSNIVLLSVKHQSHTVVSRVTSSENIITKADTGGPYIRQPIATFYSWTPPASGLPSDRWRPMVFMRCVEGMPAEAAPCLNYSNLKAAEEIVYPDFRIRLPNFVETRHRQLLKFLTKRFRHQGDWAYYLNQHGRNLVFTNTSYQMVPPPKWLPNNEHCMGGKLARHAQFAQASSITQNTHERVMFAASPDSYSFQHWLDRVAPMLVQTRHLQTKNILYIAQVPRDASVADGWGYLAAANQSRLLAPQPDIHARNFVFACDTPLIHPWLLNRISELMMTAAGLDPTKLQLSNRKVVMVFSRMEANARNGRRWLNYQQCLPMLQQLLDDRRQNEYLEVFDPKKFPSLKFAMLYWSQNVRAVVGMHGGGFYNLYFATAPLSVVEIWPVSADGRQVHATTNLFWEVSRLRGFDYWLLPATTVSASSSDANADCSMITAAVRLALGRGYATVLEPFYQGTTWSA